MSQSYVESHWEKKCEAKDKELEELKAEMKRAGEIMTVMGRLLGDGEVRSLAEIKKKASPKIQTVIKAAARYVRDIAWAKRKVLTPGYSMYSEEEGTYCSELMRVVKPFIPRAWDPAVFWHVFLVSVTKSVYNSMRSEATRGMKRTAKGESNDVPAMCFMT
jgi:hypothetical protein